ncbi:MAG TPA: hypothetical protein GX509_09590 [Firmicutes bacterium]|nr:hypothetical protein [Bacillota bacterium]HHY98976.1 hypothetical protein [Bacillota bacterium]
MTCYPLANAGAEIVNKRAVAGWTSGGSLFAPHGSDTHEEMIDMPKANAGSNVNIFRASRPGAPADGVSMSRKARASSSPGRDPSLKHGARQESGRKRLGSDRPQQAAIGIDERIAALHEVLYEISLISGGCC